jgi:hypothetical protein
MKKGTMTIEAKTENGAIKVLINGLPAVCIKQDSFEGFHAWIFSHDSFFIEFTLSSGSTITREYDTRDKWERILKALDNLKLFS